MEFQKKTILQPEDLKPGTVAVLYLCKLTDKELIVEHSIEFNNHFSAIQSYANIPNPESQLMNGKTREELIERINFINSHLKNKDWLNHLKEMI